MSQPKAKSDPLAEKRATLKQLLIAAGKEYPGMEHDIAFQPEVMLDELLRHYGGDGPGFVW
jgi:hypothetical protein